MKQNYKEILESALSYVRLSNPDSIIGFLPPVGGIALSCAGGDATTDMAGNSYLRIRLNVNAKATSQVECVEMLDKVHGALQRMNIDNDDYHIYCGQIIGTPQMAAQDAQGMWILTSVVRIKAVSERTV